MAMHGLRLILFIAGVYSLVMGAINVNQLRGVLQDTEKYFGKTGQFQTEIIKFMDLLDSMSTDIKDLTFAAKASICELNKYYLVRSIAYDDDKNQSNDILGDLNPISYGFTDEKLNKVLQFERDVKACKNIPGEGNEDYADHYSKRLEAYKVQYKLIIN